MNTNQQFVIHWFRRDLRLHDNHALASALSSGFPVRCIFIFDTHILAHLPAEDARVQFIHAQISAMKKSLQDLGSDLYVIHGSVLDSWISLAEDPFLQSVYTNRDYEPYALERDQKVREMLYRQDIEFLTFKDHVIFEKQEITTLRDSPYTVYTPYNKAWKEKMQIDINNLEDNIHLREFKINLKNRLLKATMATEMPTLKSLGFSTVKMFYGPTELENINIENYDELRDIPSVEGTTRLGTALRFGTVSIRETMKMAIKSNNAFWNELIWREFFSQILSNFPYVSEGPFRKKYEKIEWRNSEKEFQLWCNGQTGYPLVDAGMRELNETGFMHNRIRMVTASFLVKHLLIDWRWGEAYFAEKLMDYELASNNGNWQWVAGCGTDAAPYFRIFNPESQQKKFDPHLTYVKKWVKDWGTSDYPYPIVDHKEARERCLKAYKIIGD